MDRSKVCTPFGQSGFISIQYLQNIPSCVRNVNLAFYHKLPQLQIMTIYTLYELSEEINILFEISVYLKQWLFFDILFLFYFRCQRLAHLNQLKESLKELNFEQTCVIYTKHIITYGFHQRFVVHTASM